MLVKYSSSSFFFFYICVSSDLLLMRLADVIMFLRGCTLYNGFETTSCSCMVYILVLRLPANLEAI